MFAQDPRADIPREHFYYPGIYDAVRSNAPYAPPNGNVAGPQVPLLGLGVLVAAVLVFEHFRKGR